MKHQTATLEGALLDAAVAKAEGMLAVPDSLLYATIKGERVKVLSSLGPAFQPSQSWLDGGPIIERERIDVRFDGKAWCSTRARRGDGWLFGPTPLIAAMRAYVASKFGEEVEL